MDTEREFLSFNTCGELFLITVTGALHVAPWSVERLTSTAPCFAPKGVVALAGSSTREKKNAVPSRANAVQGSEARMKSPRVHFVTSCGIESFQ